MEKKYLVSYWEMKAEWGIEIVTCCNMNWKKWMGRSGLGIWKFKILKRTIFAIAVLHAF
jgi:hypothetical protein